MIYYNEFDPGAAEWLLELMRAGEIPEGIIDTRSILGHMLELYKPVPSLTRFYDAVAGAARKWDGKELFRYISQPGHDE